MNKGAAEINVRTIPGNGGTVAWTYDPETHEHVIAVTAFDGYLAGQVATIDGAEAAELFAHPFAVAAVADIFSRKTTGGNSNA